MSSGSKSDQDGADRVLFASPDLGAGELAAIERIHDLRHRLRYYTAESRRWIGSIRKMLSAKAIQGSNSIEGYDVSVDEAMAAVVGRPPDGDSPDENVQAVVSYQRAMTYVLQLAADPHFNYEPATIRSLHFIMTEYDLGASPGLWRPGPIWIRNDLTGEIVYEGPDEAEVPDLVSALMAELGRGDDLPVMVAAAMAHLNLVMIHPFKDGNGRMARCLQTLVLAREGVVVPEFASIEEFLGRNTQWYYEVLAETGQGGWNPQNSTRAWVRFCLVAHYVQAASVLRRITESEELWGRLEAMVSAAGVPERSVGGLFDATLGLQLRNVSYRSAVAGSGEDISNQSATNDLNKLVTAGLLERRGAKRGSHYVAGEPLRAIRQDQLKHRQPIRWDDLFEPAL